MFNPHWMRINIQPSTWINDFMRVDLTLIVYILSRVFYGKSREEQEMQEIVNEFNHSYAALMQLHFGNESGKCWWSIYVKHLSVFLGYPELDQQIQSFFIIPAGLRYFVKDTVVFLNIPEGGC